MNPQSLDLSIQSALSALFPPFEATAPIVLSQLFRTIDERYHGDALQCLLDFLIPSKHLLESVQQAACAGYSDVVFRCEGWPLCLHDKTVIQLAPVNPLLLRPGDFYLQVEPFGDQAARIVLKSLLEEGCREVEETPIPETSYPCMFTEEWLLDINEGRHGTPLSRCLLCTDQGVIKLPWDKIANPEFLNKPKIMPTCGQAPLESHQISAPFHFSSSTLPVDAVIPQKDDRMSASLRSVNSARLIKMDHERRGPRSGSKSLIKPVGWVSPNTWESHNHQEIEGDYVDLVDIAKGKEFVDKQSGSVVNPPNLVLLKPVRPPPPVPRRETDACGHNLQSVGEIWPPCSQRKLGEELTDQDMKCRYRDSYLAALKNPVPFERGSVDLLAALEEVGLCEEQDGRTRTAFAAHTNHLKNFCNHCNKPVACNESCQHRRHSEQTPENCVCYLPSSSQSENLMKEFPMTLQATPDLSHNQRSQTEDISHHLGHTASVHPFLDVSLENCAGDLKRQQKGDVVKSPGKHKVIVRSVSSVSETCTGSPVLYKLNKRSLTDICPTTVTGVIQCQKSLHLDQDSEKQQRQEYSKEVTDSNSRRMETLSDTNGPCSKLNSKTEKPSSAQVQLPATSSESQLSPQPEERSFTRISSLLELGIICLPGSRDRNGRAVVEVYGDRKEWMSPLVSAQSICELLLYLHSIPRKDVRELGMALVINARKRPPPVQLYKALLMAQEQALHAVHSIIVLMDKDTNPRPEKQPGLQIEMVNSLRALNKTVEASQLTSGLGGTFTYIHADWLKFHERLVLFMVDLQGADNLLQKAIKRVDSRKKIDTPQEVQQSIEEQKVSMKEVLEDVRLVTLQREGGALLARMRREEFRFPQSEDYRDALESVTSLYNQVEEKLHTLVMRSNESLQHLEFLLRLREMEAQIITAGLWFSAEGEERLNDSFTTDELLTCTEKALQDFNLFLSNSKDKQQHALTLIKEAEEIVSANNSSPATDIFRTLVSTFKSNVEDFILRAEQRQKELDTQVHVYSFCEQVTALAQECCILLEQVEKGCNSAQTLSTLQIYEERLGGEFSTLHFQALRAKACGVGSGASGMMRVWNAAWIQSQKVRQRLEKMQMKKRVDKNQIQQTTTANPPEDRAEMWGEGKRNELGIAESSMNLQSVSITEVVTPSKNKGESTSELCSRLDLKNECKGNKNQNSIEMQVSKIEDCNVDNKWKFREHHSEADLRSSSSATEGQELPVHQTLARSLSEGSCPTSISGFSPLIISHEHCCSEIQPLDQDLQAIQNLSISCREGLWQKHLSCEAKTDNDKEEGERCAFTNQRPEHLEAQNISLTPTDNNGNSFLKVQRILEELLSTEREYVKALGYVQEHYFPELERADVPQDLRGQRGSIFGNLEKLHDFHHRYFSDELESCLKEPFRVGRCFLKHKESFALYALYSKNKPQSDRLLINHGHAFFKQKQLKLGDKMDLWSYLLKPVQRISKYSLLLQDLMRECGSGQTREIAEIKAALEVIHFQLRHGNNLLAMDAIHHCDVNLKEQGQLICQDEFLVTFRKKKCFRHIFLFQELVLFSKTKKTDVGNDTYIYKQSFKTSDIGMTQNSGDSGLCFEIWFRKRKSQDTYTLQASSREVKEAWTKDLERILWEQAIHNREVRMQERVFLGIGNKPFMDIQPSDAAISDRAVNYVLMGRDNKVLHCVGSSVSPGEAPGSRPKSVGSGSNSSSSSSGRGSLSPVEFMPGQKQRVVSGGLGSFASPPGALEEDDLDHDSGSQTLLLDSSESSGESVSGLSSSSHGYQSAVGGEVEDNSSVCSSIITVKEAAVGHPAEAFTGLQNPNAKAGSTKKTQPPVAPKPKLKLQQQNKNLPGSKAQSASVGKSTDV
ncbi:quattro isoform 1-T1 [Menidia menidia]